MIITAGRRRTQRNHYILCALRDLRWLFIHVKTALGGEAVYQYDPLAGRRIEACEGRAGVIKRDAPSDQFTERQFSVRDHIEKFWIGFRLHAVAAEDLQFMRDDSSHR